MAHVAIVYATDTKEIRRIVVPDAGEAIDPSHQGPGETMVLAPRADFGTVAIEALFERLTGTPPFRRLELQASAGRPKGPQMPPIVRGAA